MTVASQSEHVSTAVDAPEPPPPITLTIDGTTIQVPKGTLVIRAAEQLGIAIPRFCDHPLLDPVGACRQCIVDVEGQRKPLTACTTVVTEGMVVKTQLTSDVAKKAQAGTMELLLINHPLDCPVCDKGGECPLQNQAMSAGRPESRFRDIKRTYPKPLPISEQILLDRERCVLCARCTRFSEQIAGDPFIDLFERGAAEQVSVYRGDSDIDLLGGGSNGALPGSDLSDPFHSYFSGNTIQICPVGALTSASYRFRARPFDLVSTPSVCEHCASGCAQRTDWRRGKVLRRLAGEDAEVNEEWNCDKGRFAFTYPVSAGRITTPLLRDASGELEPVSWSRALAAAADGLAGAIEGAGVGVLTGGRLTVEDAYAYAMFARVVLGTNDIDFRSRPHSREEAGFLAAHVAGVTPQTGGITYRDLDTASTVLLAGLEPEEESPIVFLRLRKAVRRLDGAGTRVYSIAPWATRGLEKLSGTLVEAAPGTEARTLDGLTAGDERLAELSAGLRRPGAVILVGERLAVAPGALSAVARLARETGARLAWIPRRAGDRGAIDAGALPGLLPGGSSVYDAAARAELERLWGCEAGTIPQNAGRDAAGILRAAVDGELSGLLVGGVDLNDFVDPGVAHEALSQVGFVVSLELRHSSVTEHADVVLPVAATVEKAGTYYNWEGRQRPFVAALTEAGTLRDAQVLDAIAAELGVMSVSGNFQEVVMKLRGLSRQPTDNFLEVAASSGRTPDRGEAILATWHHLLDAGALQVGEPHLAATAPRPVARLSTQTADELNLSTTQLLVVSNSNGSITLPWVATDMPLRVVWLPTNSLDSAVHRDLAADSGAIVRIAAAEGGE